MKYKAILFDLDGTLLPMDMKVFTEGYFRMLAKKVQTQYDIGTKELIKAVWAGTAAMVKNDGSKKNEKVFRETFAEVSGISDPHFMDLCDEFYANEFNEAVIFTGKNPRAVEAVRVAREKAEKVVVATNPYFPVWGQETRLSWLGLKPSDFELVTDNGTDSYCKPNPDYYRSVCERIGVEPADCLMIGNDELEDMYAALQAGITGRYLITDCLIPSEEHPFDGPRGTFAEMIDMLRALE